MYYYAKEDDVRALGYIPLHGNVLKKHTYTAEEPGKYLFEILPGKGGVCPFNLSINFPACVDALDGMLGLLASFELNAACWKASLLKQNGRRSSFCHQLYLHLKEFSSNQQIIYESTWCPFAGLYPL